MAKIVGYIDILLGDLVIGKAASRTEDPAADIKALAASIQAQGLLQPIVVCPARESGKWEILAGQRRLLAHKLLKRESIPAAILDRRVEGAEAKAISITENLVRRSPSIEELIGGAAFLHNRSASMSDAVDAADLPADEAPESRGFSHEAGEMSLGLSALELGRLQTSVGYGGHKKGRPLSPIQVGMIFRGACSAGFSLKDCAEAANLADPSHARRFLRILDLPQDIQQRIGWGRSKGIIGFSVAEELTRLQDGNDQRAVAEAILANGFIHDEVWQVVQLRKRSKRPVGECLREILDRRP